MPACPARLFAFLVFYNSIYSNGRRQRKNHRTGRDKEREKETKAETEEDREKEGAEIDTVIEMGFRMAGRERPMGDN
jgi:hypothetical protein